MLLILSGTLLGAAYPALQEGDIKIANFEFASDEVLPERNLHCTTIGTAKQDASGRVRNAVLILSFSAFTC